VLSIPKHINKISKKTEDLLRKLLVVDPKYRMDWSALLKINLFEEEVKPHLPSNPIEKRLFQKKPSGTNNQVLPNQNIVPQGYNQIPPTQIVYGNNENVIMNNNVNPGVSSNINNSLNVVNPNVNPSANASVNIRTQGVLTTINNEERHVPVIIQTPSLSQSQINQNLRVLLKERNKIIFLMNVLTTLLDNPLNEKGPIIGYCLFKNVMQLGELLKANLKEENLEKAVFARKIEKIDSFKETNEFKSFALVFAKEFLQINGCLACFREDLKLDGSNYFESMDQKRLMIENLNGYLEDIKEKVTSLALEGKNEEMRQWLVLGNELVDSVNIEEFFEKFISENLKFGEQRYFDDLKKYSLADLNHIFLGKMETVHEMVRV